MDKKGVTLIEMLIVVAIIGILAAVAIPAYVGQTKRAARAEAYTNLQNLRMLQEQYFAENGEYAPNTATTDSTATTTLLYGVFSGTTYDTSNNATNARNIYSFLPGFKPGLAADLNYNYEISFTVSSNSTTTFIATATGKTGTKVEGDSFTINQSNVKTGGW
jgi:prepilin-type N-terminal cleavage/methylation domain-containing protein